MSGDWIKIEVDLPEKPEVWQIAGIVGIDADTVVGKLLKVWRWFDAHTENGNAVGVTYPLVDHVSGVTGFAEAMALCGWLEQSGSMLTIPHFDRHNGKTAKNRAVTAKRVAKFKAESNAKGNAHIVTGALPREEKRREEKKQKPRRAKAVASLHGFEEFWSLYPKKLARADAEKAFSKLDVDEAMLATICGALKKQIPSWTDLKFAPYPASWLNGKRWRDEVSSSQANGSTPDYMVGAL